MAKKIFTLPWTMQELKTFCEGIIAAFSGGFLAWLNRMRTRPFVIRTDERDKCKRIFFTEEDADKWFAERDSEEGLTPETAALEFPNIDGNGTIPGSEQYQLTCAVVNDGGSAMKGTEGINLLFNFSTVDRINNAPLGESVEISFTFHSDYGDKKVGGMFEYTTEVTKFDMTDYLEEGENTITMIVRGRSTGLTRTVIATYTLIDLQLTSDFNIAKAQQDGQTIYIPYYVKGPDAKNIQIYIDGQQIDNIPVAEGEARDTYALVNNLTLGHHTLQMKAIMLRGDKQYESNLLYFDFVNNGTGLNLTCAMIKAVFPAGTAVFQLSNPGLIGEQYVDYLLNWAYFSTEYPRSVVLWKTKVNGMESIVGSREVDEKEGQVDVMPDPVQFQPDQVGTYDIYATIAEIAEPIGQFTINVKPNSAGLSEKTTGLEMKLTGLGRSNNEPADTRNDWSNNGYKTHFNAAMDFSSVAGYTGRAVRFDGCAAGYNECKPFAEENSVLTNGMAMTFYFRTRNVINENIPLIEIGKPDTDDAYFAIYGKKALLKPSMGETLEYPFASEEDTHLDVVIFPKEFGTDKQMMFFIINGVQAPGKQYASSAFFTIGKKADTSDTYGMIHFGTETKEAAIDIYSIRTYIGTLSMWNGMNTFIIDHGGNIGALMKKNNIFRNNAIETPNTDAIRERFRTIEVIGDLGSLEEATEKVNFKGSVRYRDPFDPKFNFERMDGKVFFETAGQSRVSDLMAKSFHVDLNDDETVKTYQDGVLTHKNRVIFAEGNVYENAVRVDLCGADSSIARNASHFKMVNRIYPNVQVSEASGLYDAEYPYPLRTPAINYALSQYGKDMAAVYGGSETDYPFPHNICLEPDSVPVVILWHKEENDALQVYGIGMMMQEKKAAYANHNHSIYLKERLADGRLDPYDRLPGVNGDRGWDNEGTIEMEYVRSDNFTQNISAEGWNSTSRELAFEISFPKSSDFKKDPTLKERTWQTFYTEYVKPLAEICEDQATFDREIENIIWMPSFAAYHNKCLDKKMNDSLCRNMKILRVFIKGKWVWFAKWWDGDVSTGLFKSGAYGVDPATTRQTKDVRGEYVMEGHDVRLWNRLENNTLFNRWCDALAEASYNEGWTCDADLAAQDAIVDAFCEGLYNLDGLQKYLSAWRKGNDYMVRYQGSSVPYRHGFLKASYAIREAEKAIGDYGKNTVEFRATGAQTDGKAIRAIATQKWWFGLALGEAKIVTGIIKQPSDNIFDLNLDSRILAREFVRVFGADKMRMIDISAYLYRYSDNIIVGKLTECEELYVGYPDKATLEASEGFNPLASISFNGLDQLARLRKFSIMGLTGMQTVDLSTMPLLTHFYAAASGLLAFTPASGTKLQDVTLPDCLEEIRMEKSTIGTLGFYRTVSEGHTIEECACPTSLRYLSLIGMGNDEGTHNLVHDWLTMVRTNSLEDRVTINYRAINWQGMSKQDLLTLATIPASQRNLSGYVMCSEPFTIEEMATLTTAFGACFDIGNISNTLVCDCPGSGITISAVGETVEVMEGGFRAEQGNAVRLTGAGFPISGSNAKNYRWRAFYEGEYHFGSEPLPECQFGDFTLNFLTGELRSVENGVKQEREFVVECYDQITKVKGETSVRIVPRSYPDAVETHLSQWQGAEPPMIEGVLQITSTGVLVFRAKNFRTDGKDFTGTMLQDGGRWVVQPEADFIEQVQLPSITDPRVEFAVRIKSLPMQDANIEIAYTSHWADGAVLTAESIHMSVMSIIEQLLVNDSVEGNPVLFRAVEAAGISHKAPAWYTSQELKLLRGTLSFRTLLGDDVAQLTSLRSGQYNVLGYLKNVIALDLRGTSVAEVADVRQMPVLEDVEAEATNASIKF